GRPFDAAPPHKAESGRERRHGAVGHAEGGEDRAGRGPPTGDASAATPACRRPWQRGGTRSSARCAIAGPGRLAAPLGPAIAPRPAHQSHEAMTLRGLDACSSCLLAFQPSCLPALITPCGARWFDGGGAARARFVEPSRTVRNSGGRDDSEGAARPVPRPTRPLPATGARRRPPRWRIAASHVVSRNADGAVAPT